MISRTRRELRLRSANLGCRETGGAPLGVSCGNLADSFVLHVGLEPTSGDASKILSEAFVAVFRHHQEYGGKSQ
jgi:hypothetical protein